MKNPIKKRKRQIAFNIEKKFIAKRKNLFFHTFMVIAFGIGCFVNLHGNNVFAEEFIFDDVKTGHKHFVAIQYLKNLQLIIGYKDNTFRPEQEINRAEAVNLIKRVFPQSIVINKDIPSFADVKSEDWFYDSVVEAWQNGLIKGYFDKLFHPEKTINIAESLKITLLRENQGLPEKVTVRPYEDVPIDIWFAPYAQVSKERTLFLESRNKKFLYPDAAMDRGFFAELLYRIIKSSQGSRFARATWYSDSLANNSTASGEPYDPKKYTAAHKTLPFGTRLLVTNMANGKNVEVKINDRGPYASGIDLDLSRSAFESIASASTGIITVEFRKIPETPAEILIPPKISEYGF